jgi:uncharacterized small protein (DUF1192 family)
MKAPRVLARYAAGSHREARQVNLDSKTGGAAMAIDELDEAFGKPRKKPTVHEIGQSIDTLSVEELRERIEMLRGEITRLEGAVNTRDATRLAAAAFFKPST